MLFSPYLFDTEHPQDEFQKVVGDYKAWYLWATALELGTALAHTMVSINQEGIVYFIVDPSMDQHPFISPEDFISMLTGHEQDGKYWGYVWTIKEMARNWHLLLASRYPDQNLNFHDYALQINEITKKIDIVPKAAIWKGIEEINF